MIKERIIKVFLIAGLATGIIHIIRSNYYDYKRANEAQFWIRKVHFHRNFDVLIYGDSRVYRGIAPSVMAKELQGYRIFNFGFKAASYSPLMLEEIEKRLDGSSGKKILVLGITPYSLTKKATADDHYRQELNRKREDIIQYGYLVPLMRVFEPIDAFTVKQKIKESFGIPGQPYYHEEYYPEEGWVASWKTPPDTAEALEPYAQAFTNNQVSEEIIQSLMDHVGGWRNKGIHIFGFFPPTTSGMKALEKRLSGFNEEEFINQFKQAGGIWIPVKPGDYKSYDGSHLEKGSAVRLSDEIGIYINSFLQNKRKDD